MPAVQAKGATKKITANNTRQVLNPTKGKTRGHKCFSHLSLSAAKFTSTYQKSNAKVLTTTTPVKSTNKTSNAMTTPTIQIETYGVPNLTLINRKTLGKSFRLAIEKAILLTPKTAVSKTLAVATKPPAETICIANELPVAPIANVKGEVDKN